jgi:3-hydroxybutyryl-CoA dehydrogenase
MQSKMDNNDRVITIAGAGVMGAGIAHAFASAGFRTCLFDLRQEALDRAANDIRDILGGGVKLGKIEASAAQAAMSRLHCMTDIGSAAGADLFVETVSENLAAKLEVIRRGAPTLAAGAIIATNTSALSVTEIAAHCPVPERVIGMHFFNPVHKMKLVEIVLALSTSPQTLADARQLVEAIGKTSIVVNESPGLTTSRMSALLGNEAMYMLLEGAATAEDIDIALRLGLNHPMGPLELGDLTGWDTRLAVLRYLHTTLGEKFRPCPLITKMVAAGRLGRKTGAGVYLYVNGEKVSGSGLKASAF